MFHRENGVGKTNSAAHHHGEEEADEYLKSDIMSDFGYYDQGQLLLMRTISKVR